MVAFTYIKIYRKTQHGLTDGIQLTLGVACCAKTVHVCMECVIAFPEIWSVIHIKWFFQQYLSRLYTLKGDLKYSQLLFSLLILSWASSHLAFCSEWEMLFTASLPEKVIISTWQTSQFTFCTVPEFQWVVHTTSTLNSTYNEVAFNEKLAIMKENLHTKYTPFTYIMMSPLMKSCL